MTEQKGPHESQPMPIPVVVAPSNPSSTMSLIVRWLFGQEATTVALFLILGAVGWFAKYVIDFAVPRHLKQIQEGYEEINAVNDKQIRFLQDSADKNTERQERLLREIFIEQKVQGREQRARDRKTDGEN